MQHPYSEWNRTGGYALKKVVPIIFTQLAQESNPPPSSPTYYRDFKKPCMPKSGRSRRVLYFKGVK